MSETGSAPTAERNWVRNVLKVQVGAKPAPKLVMAGTRTAQPPQPAPQAQPAGPSIGAQRTPERLKTAFEQKLGQALSQIETARSLAAASDAAATAHTDMENALGSAVAAAKAGDFQTANGSLDAALVAGGKVSDERVAAKAACETRLGTLQKRVATVRKTVEVAQPASPAALAAVGTVEAVGKAAELAVEAEPEDWRDAALKLDAFDTAIGTLEPTLATAVGALLAGLKTRLTAATSAPPIGGGQIKLRGACAAAHKKLAGLITAQDGTAALAAYADAAKATKALEDAGAPNGAAKIKMRTDAAAALTALSDSALATTPMAEKAQLAFDLCAGGPPSGDALDQLTRLYRASPPQAEFLTARDEERAKIAATVAALPGVSKLFKADGTASRTEWRKITADPVKARALLQEVSDEQLKILGLPSVPVTTYSQPSGPNGTSMGGYDTQTREIGLNAHPDALTSAREALTSILHESFHAQQHILVGKLLAGEIAPDDPIYPQVLMFAANFPPGYLPPSASQADYEAQPIEIDAETEGARAAVAVQLAVQANKVIASAGSAGPTT